MVALVRITPLRTDFTHVRPLPSGEGLPQRLKAAIGAYFHEVGVGGEPLVDAHFNAPPHEGLALEVGLRAAGFADLKGRWSGHGPADGVVFEAAIFPVARSIPLVACVAAASVEVDGAIVPLGAEVRARIAALEGDKPRALRSVPRDLRALRKVPGREPASRPGVALGAFADLGERVPVDHRAAARELALWFHLPQHSGQSTLFAALPEGPMPQATVDALTAVVTGILDAEATGLHRTLGPAASLVWGFHASAPLAEVAAAFERDGFDLRPLPPIG